MTLSGIWVSVSQLADVAMNSSGITNWRGLVFLFRLRRFEGISCEMKINDKKLKNTNYQWKLVKFPFLQRKEVGSISANSVWIPFHPDLNCGGVVKTFQRGESQVWISALLTWVGLSRFLPCVSAGSYSRGEMELPATNEVLNYYKNSLSSP